MCELTSTCLCSTTLDWCFTGSCRVPLKCKGVRCWARNLMHTYTLSPSTLLCAYFNASMPGRLNQTGLDGQNILIHPRLWKAKSIMRISNEKWYLPHPISPIYGWAVENKYGFQTKNKYVEHYFSNMKLLTYVMSGRHFPLVSIIVWNLMRGLMSNHKYSY